ncbi:alpha/beta hydrolase family protein [Oecophyllibacter saccharovorans]|uniref:alpha/beta hydrolase family protein n=1 Tax=Oecophyllibacter saccharovorans TaxID=2558360 RepID=UPI0018C8AA97|nr:alpha/beta hydrolase [Oecophyllibacter saccharovorans]
MGNPSASAVNASTSLSGHTPSHHSSPRLSPQRMEEALHQLSTISPQDLEKVNGLAAMAKPAFRSFLYTVPGDRGMAWESLSIPSEDGTPLEAWYIPATGPDGAESDKLVIYNHPLPMCRAGFPGHFGQPWSTLSDVQVDFVQQMRYLHDAGYNVLAYDFRNFGNSSAANGGVSGIGRWEWRDCVGVKQFVDAHPKLSRMKVGLYSQCMGGMAQYEAISNRPELFANVACMCSPMVPSMGAIFSAFGSLMGIEQYLPLIDLQLVKMGAWTMEEMNPRLFAPAVTMPVLMFQVLHDSWTRNPEDGQATFDALGSKEKELIWVPGTNRFRDGYGFFNREPGKILPFFKKYLG